MERAEVVQVDRADVGRFRKPVDRLSERVEGLLRGAGAPAG
jgi:hypothetical protein